MAVTYALPSDSRNWHRHAFGHHLNWGRMRGQDARRFAANADRSLIQVEVFGWYAEICR